MDLVQTVLLVTGLVLTISTLLFAAASARLTKACRPYGYAAAVTCGAMAVAYLLMLPVENAGLETDYIRFVG